jgi:hypothetical protein
LLKKKEIRSARDRTPSWEKLKQEVYWKLESA